MTAEGSLWPRAREHFRRLCDLSLERRAAELAAIDREEPELGRYVRELLRHDSQADDDLAGAVDEFRDAYESALPSAERHAGRWSLEEVIGRGGMGEVWRARRSDAGFEQVAALKLLKRGMDSEALLGRFLQERRILARLDHPNIARLLDGGMTASGRPYFAMELVEGEPVTDFVRQNRLDLASTLRLFLRICDAVDFAHRNLVVHRDLKPSNILVDADGHPRLLDFGIAKMLVDEEGEGSTATLTRMRALTPAYAAPEQVIGGAVTTATDVFSLGLILFELLTGDLPAQRRHASDQAPASLAEDITTRPSQAIRRAGSGGAQTMTSRRLARQVAGDLDAIVLTALRHDPERRYPSAAALADDIRDFLDGRPVAARPDSVGYRLRRFVRRHRTGVGLGAVALIALVAGLLTAVWQARVASEALVRMESEYARAESEFRRAEAARNFLISLFRSTNPGTVDADATRTVRDLLMDAGEELEGSLSSEPSVQAELRLQIANSLRSYGDTEAALVLVDRALAHFRSEASGDLYNLATALQAKASLLVDLARIEEAEALIRECLELLPASVTEERERRLRRAMLTTLGRLLSGSGREAEALAVYRQDLIERTHELGPNHPDLATPWFNLGVNAIRAERFGDALEALEQAERIVAPDESRASVRYLYLWIALSISLDALGRTGEAQVYHERAMRMAMTHFPDHRSATSFINRQGAMLALGRRDLPNALAAARTAMANSVGTDIPLVARSAVEVMLAAGAFDEAREVALLGHAAAVEQRGEMHPLAVHLKAAATISGCLADCDPVAVGTLETAAATLRTSSQRRLAGQAVAWLALAVRRSEPARSEQLEREAASILGEIHPPQHVVVATLSGTRLIQPPSASTEP